MSEAQRLVYFGFTFTFSAICLHPFLHEFKLQKKMIYVIFFIGTYSSKIKGNKWHILSLLWSYTNVTSGY